MVNHERKLWDGIWSGHERSVPQAHRALIQASENVLGGFNNKSTLEVGAGRAVDSIEMAKRGANSFAFDLSDRSFHISLQIAENSGVHLIPTQGDIEELPFADESFDLVFSQGLMEHPGAMERSLPEQVRVTKPGGYVLVDVPQLFSIQAMAKWIQLRLDRWPYGEEVNFTENELKDVLRSEGLEPVRSYGREVMPILHLGIRTYIANLKNGNSMSVRKNAIQELPESRDIMNIFEHSPLGPKILNNVGVVARK